MDRDKIWYLKKFNLLQTMNDEEMKSMSETVLEDEVRKKQPIYLQGDPSETLYFLKKGLVKLSRLDESGKEITLTLLEPGEVFGELGIFDNSPRETTAVALEDCLICAIRRNDFEKLMEKKSDISFKLSKLMGLRLRHIESRIQELMFRDVPSRLASLLLRLAAKHPREMKRGLRINIKLSQQELANLVGATREMTSSVLNVFKRNGWIDIESKYIYIINRSQLEKIAS